MKGFEFMAGENAEGTEMKPLTQDEADKVIRNTLRAFNQTFGEVRPQNTGCDGGRETVYTAKCGITKAIRELQE